LSIVAVGTAVAIGIVAGIAVWTVVASWGKQSQLKITETWARQTTLRLRAESGGEKLIVRVPVRMTFASGPSFFLAVGGSVLDDDANSRLRAVFDSAGPPKNVSVHWNPWTCNGDAKAYQKMEIDQLED
jgi:hypothetical protein